MKKTLVQVDEETVVVADEVVALKEYPNPNDPNGSGYVTVLLNGGHKLNVLLKEGESVINTAAMLFSFSEADDTPEEDNDGH